MAKIESPRMAERRERINAQYYIDRLGKKIKYKKMYNPRIPIEDIISIHAEIARALFPNITYPKDPEEYIMNTLGWILVGSTCYRWPITHEEPSNKQIKVIIKLHLMEKLSILIEGNYVNYHEYDKERTRKYVEFLNAGGNGSQRQFENMALAKW